MRLDQTLRLPFVTPFAAVTIWRAALQRWIDSRVERRRLRPARCRLARLDAHLLRDIALVAEVHEVHKRQPHPSSHVTPEGIRNAPPFRWTV